ncbi:MAG: hypothetical protein K6F94_08570 [Bacteroidaceae bacterium]|nr:hypothetical protein [Bacteroidaceae bacterium]
MAKVQVGFIARQVAQTLTSGRAGSYDPSFIAVRPYVEDGSTAPVILRDAFHLRS